MDELPFHIDRKDLIEGLGKGLRIVEAFDDDHPRLTPSEAASRAGLTRTAARRYLLSLCHFGYAATDGKQFWLQPRVLRLGQSYLGAARLPRLVQPFIQRLSMATGETVNVSVLDGHEVVYVARSNSPRVVSVGFHVGARVPAHVVSAGVVLLSALDDAALRRWSQAHEFAGFTGHTVTEAPRFVELVREARTRPFWITEQQLDAGITGVAVLLRDRRGHGKAAASMTLPAQPWPEARIAEKLAPGLQELTQLLRPLL